MVDTNTNPDLIDFPIPANDDASKSINVILEAVVNAIDEGLSERKLEKDKKASEDEDSFDENGDNIGGRAFDIDDDDDAETKRRNAKKAKDEADGMSDSSKRPRKPIAKPSGLKKKPIK